MLDDEALPRFQYLGRIGQQEKEPPNADNFILRFRARQSQTILLDTPRSDRPKFNQILRCDAESFVAQAKPRQRVFDDPVMRVARIQRTQQDIGIGERSHYSPRSA